MNGNILYGHDGFAELGHLIVEQDGRECGCGNWDALKCMYQPKA